MIEIKNEVQAWLEEHQEYELTRRISFLSEEDAKNLLFCTSSEVENWLDKNGY